MEIKKNDKFTVTSEDMGEDGAGIGRVDGYIWFVKDALIGDTIEASAMKMKKNYGFARLVRVITPAKGRVEAKCPVARACGGTGSGSAGRSHHGTDHRNGRPVEISQQSAVSDRTRKGRKTDGRILCRTDPLPDPGTGAGLFAWLWGK